MNRLADKVAVITGGNAGVGAEIAKLFADEGAQVVISARRMDKLEKIAQEIRESGGDVLPVQCDISKPEDVQNLVNQAIHEYGQIDILINNAGILEEGMKPIECAEDEDINRIIDTNLKGTMFATRAVLKEMQENDRASIVNIASVAGEKGCGPAAYAVAKAGIIGLTKHTAFRFTGTGIRCNVICPGTIATSMSKQDVSLLNKDMMKAMRSHLDLTAGVASVEDIANIALFLASDESNAMTGQVLVSDFGASL